MQQSPGAELLVRDLERTSVDKRQNQRAQVPSSSDKT